MLKLLFNNPQNLNLNFKNIDGNRTGSALYQAFSKILEISGHESINFKKSADEIVEQVKTIFSALGWNTEVLCFDSEKNWTSNLTLNFGIYCTLLRVIVRRPEMEI